MVLGVIVIALGLILPLKSAPSVGKQSNYFISGVNVVDTISGGVSVGMTVVVSRVESLQSLRMACISGAPISP